jgi:hypothetical protein
MTLQRVGLALTSSVLVTFALPLILPFPQREDGLVTGTMNTVYDRVILGGRVMDPASDLDAVRNIGLLGGRIAIITTEAVRGRDTVDARGLVVAPGWSSSSARRT